MCALIVIVSFIIGIINFIQWIDFSRTAAISYMFRSTQSRPSYWSHWSRASCGVHEKVGQPVIGVSSYSSRDGDSLPAQYSSNKTYCAEELLEILAPVQDAMEKIHGGNLGRALNIANVVNMKETKQKNRRIEELEVTHQYISRIYTKWKY